MWLIVMRKVCPNIPFYKCSGCVACCQVALETMVLASNQLSVLHSSGSSQHASVATVAVNTALPLCPVSWHLNVCTVPVMNYCIIVIINAKRIVSLYIHRCSCT